jgi:hypothetical protein
MKKAFAYAAIAVVLGVALMFTPFAFFTTESYDEAPISLPEQPSPERLINTLKESTFNSERSAGITPNYPLDAISVGIMLLFSLALAFTFSLLLKRKHFASLMDINS